MTFDPSAHLTKLKGKDYLEAKWRLVWLRDEHPNAVIETQHIDIDLEKNHAIFRATVTIPDKGSATGYGSESSRDFGDFIEKAETKALARALAALGYGTQFTGDELAEGERIVDSPVQRHSAPQPIQRQQEQPQQLRRPTTQEANQAQMLRPNDRASDRQLNFIIGLAKELGMNSDNGHHDPHALDAEVRQITGGGTMETINKGQAKMVIDEFMARPKTRTA